MQIKNAIEWEKFKGNSFLMLFYGEPYREVKFGQREMGIVYNAITNTKLENLGRTSYSNNQIRKSENCMVDGQKSVDHALSYMRSG